jgi:CelD/BcsL family acetyltransferase involved in cellulose biosynthesis
MNLFPRSGIDRTLLFATPRSRRNDTRVGRQGSGPNSRFEVHLHGSFDFSSREFVGLFARSEASPFQHPLWLDRLYAHLVRYVGAEPAVVTLRCGKTGLLVAVLPLIRRRCLGVRFVEFADLGVSDYVMPICDRDLRSAILADERVAEQIREILTPYDLVRISKIPDHALPLAHMLMAGRPSRMATTAHAVPLFAPFGKWRMMMLKANRLRSLDRKRRKLSRKGRIQIDLVSDPAVIGSAFTTMKQFRQSRFAAQGWPDILQQPAYWKFYLDIATKGSALGFARTHVLSLDQRPLGVMFGLAHGEKYFLLLMGFDFANFRNYSIGLLLLEDLASDCVARGDTLLDLTTGDEAYKYDFGTTATVLSEIRAGGTLTGTVASAALGAPWTRALAKRMLRGSSII